MPLEIRCPLGHAIVVPASHVGTRYRCPVCYQIATIPVDPPPDEAQRPEASQSVGALRRDVEPEPLPPARQPATARRPRAGEANFRAIVHAISIGMLLLAGLQALPIISAWQSEPRPLWMWLLLLLVSGQSAYALWLALIPDWTTLRVAMVALALVASIYSALAALVVCAPRSSSLLFELDDVREPARLWCSVVMVLATIVTYSAGHASFAWRRQRERQAILETSR